MHIIVHTTTTNDPARDRRVRQEVKTAGTRSYRFDKGQSVQRETKADGFAPPKVVPVVQEVPATIPDTFEPGSATAPMDTEQSGGVGQVAAATGAQSLGTNGPLMLAVALLESSDEDAQQLRRWAWWRSITKLAATA